MLKFFQLLMPYLDRAHLEPDRTKLSVQIFVHLFCPFCDSFIVRDDLHLYLHLSHVVPHRFYLIKLFVKFVSLLPNFEYFIRGECPDLFELGLTNDD